MARRSLGFGLASTCATAALAFSSPSHAAVAHGREAALEKLVPALSAETPLSQTERGKRRRMASLDLADMALLNSDVPGGEVLQPRKRTFRRTSALSRGLSTFSVAASLLCILDCTVLPLVFLLMSLGNVGFLQLTPCEVHCLSQKLGNLVVLPIGSLAAVTSFLQHRQPAVLMTAVTGLCLIAISNFPAALPWGTTGLPLHTLGLLGSFTLIASQWRSQSLLQDCTGWCANCLLPRMQTFARSIVKGAQRAGHLTKSSS